MWYRAKRWHVNNAIVCLCNNFVWGHLFSLTFWGLEGENHSISTNTKVAIAESVYRKRYRQAREK
jgi:hypothetical protein